MVAEYLPFLQELQMTMGITSSCTGAAGLLARKPATNMQPQNRCLSAWMNYVHGSMRVSQKGRVQLSLLPDCTTI